MKSFDNNIGHINGDSNNDNLVNKHSESDTFKKKEIQFKPQRYGKKDNEKLEDRAQDNYKLTEYQKILKQLVDLRTKVEYRKKILSDEDKKNIKDLFDQATNKVTNENVNQKYNTYTLIELAAYFGKDEIITILLGVNHLETLKEEPDQLGSAIYWAAYNGHTEALEKLINNTNIIITVIDKNHNQLGDAIHYTAYNGHHKALEFLLNKEAILKTVIDKCPDKLGEAIYYTAYNGHHKALELLLNKEAILKTVIDKCPDKLGDAICDAAYNGHTEALKLLLDKKDVLKAVIASGNSTNDILKNFLETQNNVNTVIDNHGNQLGEAIKFAAEKGHQKSLELLLSNDKIINAIIKDSGKDNLKDALDQGFEGNKDKVADIIATRNQIVLKRNITTGIGAGIAGSAVGLGTIAGAFTAKLLASKSTTVKNCISLVVNCFLPIFNATNNLLMKISPKLDLNNLAKALSNPIVTGLIVGVIAIVGAITSSIVAGVGAHKKQGGTILGR